MMDAFNSLSEQWLYYFWIMNLQNSLFLILIMGLIYVAKKYNLILADRLALLGLIKFFIPPVIPISRFWAQSNGPEGLILILTPIASFSGSTSSTHQISLTALLFIGWISFAAFFAIRAAINYRKLKQLVRNAEPFEQLSAFKNIPIFNSPVPHSPFVIGFFRPRIILPDISKKWTSEQLMLTLHHEIAHIERKDQWLNLLQVASLIFFPFNPLIWLFNGQLNQLKELICDRAAISRLNISSRLYVENLTQLVGSLLKSRYLGIGALSLSENYIHLKKRILFHLNKKEDRDMLKWKKSYLALLVGIGLLAFPLSCQWKSDTPAPEKTNINIPAGQQEVATVPFVKLTEKPSIVQQEQPVYPEIAKKAGIEGMVVLKVLVDSDGTVTQTQILKSKPDLDDAAINAAKKFKFTPGKLNGKPVKVWMTIPFNFRLKKEGSTK